MRPLLVAIVLALLAPLAAGQGHGHASGDGVAFALHDGPDSGRAVVGALTHFGFVLLGPDGAPVVHRDAEFTVVQEGVVVFSTTDAHEYDGHFSFDYTFTRAGKYAVTAASEKMTATVFEGEAIRVANATEAQIVFEKSASPQANAVAGSVSIVDAAGKLLDHTDALVEFRGPDGRLAARFHAHVHDAPIQFAQALPALPGSTDFSMRIVAYKAFATGRGEDVLAAVATFPVSVSPLTAPALPADPGAPAALEPAGAKAVEGDFALYAMYDAQNQIGLGNPMRLAGVVTKNGTPLPHVDFDLLVKGPRGVIFQSKSLHEYDGVLEYLYVPEVPGLYDATLAADAGDAKLTVPFRFQVLPPALPLAQSPGPATISITGLRDAKAGKPVELTFLASGPAGPVQHSEFDVTISHEDEAPVYQFKVHTHDSGDAKATVLFPHAADWIVRVDPLTTSPDPTTFVGPLTFAQKVEGEGLPDVIVKETASASDAPAPVPGGGILGVAFAAIAGALLMRRRA